MTHFRCNTCGECCGPVACSEWEWARIVGYIRSHGVLPIVHALEMACMLLGDDGLCMIYPVRPTLCRMHGHVAKMPCPYNPNAPRWPAEVEQEYVKRLPQIGRAVWLMDPETYRAAGLPTTTEEPQ